MRESVEKNAVNGLERGSLGVLRSRGRARARVESCTLACQYLLIVPSLPLPRAFTIETRTLFDLEQPSKSDAQAPDCAPPRLVRIPYLAPTHQACTLLPESRESRAKESKYELSANSNFAPKTAPGKRRPDWNLKATAPLLLSLTAISVHSCARCEAQ